MNSQEAGIALLRTITGVDMENGGGPTTIYTAPYGQTVYVFAVMVSNPSASLAGGTDYDIAGWKDTLNFSSVVASDDFLWLYNDTVGDALAPGDDFVLTTVTGSTVAATATWRLFGFIVRQ